MAIRNAEYGPLDGCAQCFQSRANSLESLRLDGMGHYCRYMGDEGGAKLPREPEKAE
jgi:hypothetical protein